VPFGYILKTKYNQDKKSQSVEVLSKDQRAFKFKFDTPTMFFKAVDLLSKHL
jgi:hypothetical protein